MPWVRGHQRQRFNLFSTSTSPNCLASCYLLASSVEHGARHALVSRPSKIFPVILRALARSPLLLKPLASVLVICRRCGCSCRLPCLGVRGVLLNTRGSGSISTTLGLDNRTSSPMRNKTQQLKGQTKCVGRSAVDIYHKFIICRRSSLLYYAMIFLCARSTHLSTAAHKSKWGYIVLPIPIHPNRASYLQICKTPNPINLS